MALLSFEKKYRVAASLPGNGVSQCVPSWRVIRVIGDGGWRTGFGSNQSGFAGLPPGLLRRQTSSHPVAV
jgi:hypothetical protein